MLKIGKPSYNPLASVKLPQMTSVPAIQDMQFMLTKAQRNWRAAVELPFKYASDTTCLFILTVKCDMGSGDPCWMLYRNDESGSAMIWSYVSSDVHLLRSLVHTECAASAGALQQISEEACLPDSASSGAMSLSDSRVIVGGQPAAEGDPELLSSSSLVREDAILEGDLARLQVPTLLQSIAMEKMTGRLEFQRPGETGDIFFQDGNLQHASTLDCSGDDAVLELITWQDGNFHFYEGETFLHQTTQKRLETLLMEGITLLDQAVFLSGVGCGKTSYLLRREPDITEEDFNLSLLDRTGGDLMDMRAFYDRMDDQSTLEQVLGRQPMAKTQWVPILYNLVTRNLVSVAQTLPGKRQILPDALPIDQAVIENCTKLLSRSETGMLSYPAFLYFLTQEFQRFKRGGLPFSLVVFEMNATDSRHPDGIKALPIQSLREMGSRIRAVKRDLDQLGHFETLDFAMLLPHTDLDGACTLVRRLERLIAGDPLMNTIHSHQIIAHFGIAAVPQDCDDPGVLLAAARQAKELAKAHKLPLVTFRDRDIL